MAKELKFIDAVTKLENIIEKLEEGVDDLDQVVKLFEEGSELIKFCNQKLTKVEAKIEFISKNLEQPAPAEENQNRENESNSIPHDEKNVNDIEKDENTSEQHKLFD